MNPLLLVDSYKIHHTKMYPKGMTKLYSNLTPRKSRIKGINAVVVFAIQHFILKYLIEQFDRSFFMRYAFLPKSNPQYENHKERLKAGVIKEYKRHCNVDTTHVEALWDLGYLPIEIKALEEGTLCPIGVPMLTITNTHPDFGWLVNYLETLLSCMLWQGITSATIAHEYKKLLNRYAKETTGTTDGVQWQGHDFSMRGMSSPESAILSGMGHLLSFTGTDTIPAIYELESSYRADGLIGASVPATEHSVMCMGQKEEEIATFKRLLDLYPTGILSVVSDTWDLWKVCTEYLPKLKEEILARDGKLVIRPDSGDPVDIICGSNIPDLTGDIYCLTDFEYSKNSKELFIYKDGLWEFDRESYVDLVREYGQDNISELIGSIDRDIDDAAARGGGFIYRTKKDIPTYARKGVIELLWDVFGGTVNEQGYKVLDPHIGAIYGDSITLERAEAICERLKAKGFASTNIVFGIGSFTYQYNTRDTFGFAMKATYGEITHEEYEPDLGIETIIEPREIFKDPITDDGTKKSAKGLLMVHRHTIDDKTELVLREQCKPEWVKRGKVPINHEEEDYDMLQTVFLDGKLVRETNLETIRAKLSSYE